MLEHSWIRRRNTNTATTGKNEMARAVQGKFKPNVRDVVITLFNSDFSRLALAVHLLLMDISLQAHLTTAADINLISLRMWAGVTSLTNLRILGEVTNLTNLRIITTTKPLSSMPTTLRSTHTILSPLSTLTTLLQSVATVPRPLSTSIIIPRLPRPATTRPAR